MAHVKLSPYENGFGTKTEIDGFELPDVVEIHLDFSVDSIPRLTVKMNVSKPFIWEGDANVQIVFRTFPGFRVVEEVNVSKGTRTLRVEPLASSNDSIREEER